MWLCDGCLTSNIVKLTECECYCNQCKEKQFTVSKWFVNRNIK